MTGPVPVTAAEMAVLCKRLGVPASKALELRRVLHDAWRAGYYAGEPSVPAESPYQ